MLLIIKWKYNYFLFCYYYYKSKKLNAKKKYREKIISIKKTKIINVDNNEENVYEKIILQDAEHDDNINLDGVD